MSALTDLWDEKLRIREELDQARYAHPRKLYTNREMKDRKKRLKALVELISLHAEEQVCSLGHSHIVWLQELRESEDDLIEQRRRAAVQEGNRR